MKLFLLRHAEAQAGTPDAQRALTPHGRQTVADLARFLSGRLTLDIDAVWHSPLVRAHETARLFCEAAGLDVPRQAVDGLQAMDDPAVIAERLANTSDNILLVGHNPHFESLVAHLIGVDPAKVPVNVPKASLLRFRRGGSGSNAQWQLQDLLTTKVTSP